MISRLPGSPRAWLSPKLQPYSSLTCFPTSTLFLSWISSRTPHCTESCSLLSWLMVLLGPHTVLSPAHSSSHWRVLGFLTLELLQSSGPLSDRRLSVLLGCPGSSVMRLRPRPFWHKYQEVRWCYAFLVHLMGAVMSRRLITVMLTLSLDEDGFILCEVTGLFFIINKYLGGDMLKLHLNYI